MAAPGNAWPAAVVDTLTAATRTLTYRAEALDDHWPAAGGPSAPIALAVLDVSCDFDVDRTPFGKATLTVAAKDVPQRWLSPLGLTCKVKLWATYVIAGAPVERLVFDMWLRRRSRTYPGGELVLDLATRDAITVKQGLASYTVDGG